MKLYSKANLVVHAVAGTNPKRPELHRVHLDPTGATAASNGSTFMAVGPVDPSRVRFPTVDGGAEPGPEGVGLPIDVAKQAIRNLPRDKRPSLQHAALTVVSPARVELTTVDTAKEQRVSGPPLRGRFPEWRSVVAGARRRATAARVCVNRRDLMKLLDAFDAACGDGEDGPAFLEIGGDGAALVMRGQNLTTRQHAVAVLAPYDTGGRWLEEDEWERGLLFVPGKAKRAKKGGA